MEQIFLQHFQPMSIIYFISYFYHSSFMNQYLEFIDDPFQGYKRLDRSQDENVSHEFGESWRGEAKLFRRRNVVTMPGQCRSVGMMWEIPWKLQAPLLSSPPSPPTPETQTSGRSYELFQWVYRSYSLAVSWLPWPSPICEFTLNTSGPSPPLAGPPTIARKLPRTVKIAFAMKTRRFLTDRFETKFHYPFNFPYRYTIENRRE